MMEAEPGLLSQLVKDNFQQLQLPLPAPGPAPVILNPRPTLRAVNSLLTPVEMNPHPGMGNWTRAQRTFLTPHAELSPSPSQFPFESCLEPPQSPPGLQRWKPRGAAGIGQGSPNARDGKTHPRLSSPRSEPEPRVIQQQQNQRKNNLLVLMGLVLSLPRTFQPGSRDASGVGVGREGDNEAKLFPRLQMSELSSVPLAGSGAAAGPWRCRGEGEHPRSTARDRHFPLPALH